MLDHVNKGRLSLARFVDLTSAGPQRIFGIAGKGRIAVGYDADLTIVDLKLQKTITDDWIASKCGWTPFAGRNVKGWPVGTILRGNIAMWDGELGQALRRAGPLRRGVARVLLKEILPDACRRDPEPIIAVFAALLHRQRLVRRHDPVKLDLLRRRELGQIHLGEIGPDIDRVVALAGFDEARGENIQAGCEHIAALAVGRILLPEGDGIVDMGGGDHRLELVLLEHRPHRVDIATLRRLENFLERLFDRRGKRLRIVQDLWLRRRAGFGASGAFAVSGAGFGAELFGASGVLGISLCCA